jgi:uncharacterized membrane protein
MMQHPQIVFGALMFAVAFLVGAIFWAMPRWSRPGIFFAVTVVPSFRDSPEAAKVVRNYRIHALTQVAIGFALMIAGTLLQRPAPLILGVFWLAVGPLIAVSQAHKKALAHAVAHSTIREASLAPRTVGLPGGWMLQFGPLVILAVVAIYLGLHWAQIPDEFPVHWGIDGRPNGWSVRTPIGVFGPLLFGAALVIGISLLAYVLSHSTRRVPVPGNPTASGDFAHRIAVLLLGVEYFLAAMFSLAGLLPLTGSPGVMLIVILTGAILLAAVFLLRWISRGRDQAPGTAGDGTPDSCWKLGVFYCNPDDAALFVEKRIGIGYTINFARPAAWIVLALMLALPLGMAAVAMVNQRR